MTKKQKKIAVLVSLKTYFIYFKKIELSKEQKKNLINILKL